MTATIIETDLDNAVEEAVDYEEPIPCSDLSPHGDCDEKADYDTRTACCGTAVPLCEDCFFYFIEWSKIYTGFPFKCIHCSADIIISPNHLIVFGRIN